MIASATAASMCVTGVVSAAGTVWRMLKPRRRWLARSKRRDSYVLAAEHLDHLVALDGFLEHVHEVAHRVLRLARHAAQAPRQQAHEQRDRRPDRDRDQRQLPVEVEQPAEQPDRRVIESCTATVSTVVAAAVTPPTS